MTFTAIGVGSREGQIRRPAKRRSREIVASLSASPPPTDDNSQKMLHNKICMLGGFGVGKTSLVSRFVSSIFSDTYLTTVGVKIDKKKVALDSGEMTLMLWDIYGQDELQTVRDSYLRGATGTPRRRRDPCSTLDTAVALQKRAESVIGRVPFLLLLNKRDLEREWQVDEQTLVTLVERGWRVGKRVPRPAKAWKKHSRRLRGRWPSPDGQRHARDQHVFRSHSQHPRPGGARASAARDLPADGNRPASWFSHVIATAGENEPVTVAQALPFVGHFLDDAEFPSGGRRETGGCDPGRSR